MELRHARYFLALAEVLSFTVAAKHLNISQPPLSQQIADLERELGAKLFERHSRAVKLTAAGTAFRRHAEAMVAQATLAAAEINAISRGSSGILNVAATSSVLFSGLASRLSAFKTANKDVEIMIHELTPHEQIDRLGSGRVDVSFLRFAPRELSFNVQPAWKEKVGVVVPPSHRLAVKSSVRIAALREEEFVFYRLPESAFAEHLHAACTEQGFAPRIVQQVAEAFSVVSLVTAGLGIGFVPERIGRQSDAHYLPITGPCPHADVHSLIQRDATPLARRFAEFAKL